MSAPARGPQVPVEEVRTEVYTIPTDRPEADGTIAWDSTTLVLAEVSAGGRRGLGYTYAAPAAAAVIRDTLAGAVRGADALAIPAAWRAMLRSVRNVGRPGLDFDLYGVAAHDCLLATRSFALRARGLSRTSSSPAVTGFFVTGSQNVRSWKACFTRRSSSE